MQGLKPKNTGPWGVIVLSLVYNALMLVTTLSTDWDSKWNYFFSKCALLLIHNYEKLIKGFVGNSYKAYFWFQVFLNTYSLDYFGLVVETNTLAFHLLFYLKPLYGKDCITHSKHETTVSRCDHTYFCLHCVFFLWDTDWNKNHGADCLSWAVSAVLDKRKALNNPKFDWPYYIVEHTHTNGWHGLNIKFRVSSWK